MKRSIFFITAAFLIVFTSVGLFAQIDLDEVDAAFEFQWGIVSFHRGEFNKSILAFEKSLTFKPDWEKTRIWLGNANYRAGFTDAAISSWSEVLERGGGSIDLKVKVDNLKYLRSMGPLLKGNSRFVSFHEIEGNTSEYSIFKRPSSLFPTFDGGFYLSSFATNEIHKFSANGVIQQTIRGGVTGINHPFDILETNKYLFISEYSSDRILRTSLSGNNIFRFGSSGTGDGELLGPQFFAEDDQGHIYVTESGNARVSKFDYDGNFIFSFGKRGRYFEGFLQPTGIAYLNGQILVADERKKELFLFDSSGNYLNSFTSDLLSSPEGISVYSSGNFLISDENRVILFNINSGSFRVFSETEPGSRLLQSAKDVNGNIITADFNNNKVTLLADYTRMYTGLNISIDRILSDKFPEIYVEVSVSTVDGSPYVGMAENNFLLTEDSYANYSMSLISSGNSTDFIEFSFLVEGSPYMRGKNDTEAAGIGDILDSIAGRGSLSLVTAEEVPVLEVKSGSGIDAIKESLTSKTNFSENWSFDLGVRLAAAQLIGGGRRKAVVFLSSGSLNEKAFSHYSLTETLDYLSNNNIVFYTVYINKGDMNPELE
ncbi:MAG: NHL repeat-containing protein, partial [Spirochaetales bacterium]|nr:NHL repeat-containing protein [Spirochaetales bacterium]